MFATILLTNSSELRGQVQVQSMLILGKIAKGIDTGKGEELALMQSFLDRYLKKKPLC